MRLLLIAATLLTQSSLSETKGDRPKDLEAQRTERVVLPTPWGEDFAPSGFELGLWPDSLLLKVEIEMKRYFDKLETCRIPKGCVCNKCFRVKLDGDLASGK